MTTFFLFGKYSPDALKKISPERTRKAINSVQKLGGRVKSVYALLGDNDLVFIVSLPGPGQATLASIALSKLTGISFKTCTAIPVDEFDQLINKYK
ncbi:MAG: GYD domain-containing protein [Candidatus Omnitrophota bacterium]|nr:GYD domain-containing protein [Candidatus Omnitrophota bacterium]MDZ4242267.1 GYD domain-containing protein [Candidatus Omnitrophota bacterium]